MEGIILIIAIVIILWILKKLFTSSDKIWKVAKKNGLKKTKSNENCSNCKYGNKTITTIEGQQGSIYGINCSLKDIEVREDMVCNSFEVLPKFEGANSLFGS